MFACSRVETENLFYKPKNSSSSSSSNKSKITFNLPYNNNHNNNHNSYCKRNNFVRTENDSRMKYEASLKRNQLQQELQKRHQVCAEKERLCRERAEKQMALKKVEECNALRKFYEIKSAQLKNNYNGMLRTSSSSSSLSTTTTNTNTTNSTLSSSSSLSLLSKNSKSLPSRSMSSSIKRFQAAYKIYSFIKHHIEKRKTQKIISLLIKLRSMQNQLSLLKSISLKDNLTFDSSNQVLPTSVNNKAFLIYKESILKVLNKLNNDFTDEFYLVRERKYSIINDVNIMLSDLDNFRDLQYNNFIKNIENHDDDFVIINRI